MSRIAVLGAGSHSSSNHGPALARCAAEAGGRVELAAVCDLDEARALAYASRFGFARTYTDLERMVRTEELDGIVAVTPVERTAELVTRLASTGVPLMIEKPPGTSAAAARRLRDAVAAAGTPHMVSFNRRYNPAVARARQWLQERPAPDLAVSRMLRHGRREERFVFGTGIHAVDTVVSFLGEPVYAGVTARASGAQSTPLFASRLIFANGAAALFGIAPAAGVTEESLELLGADYAVQVDVGRCAVCIHHGGEVAVAWQAPADMPPWESAGCLDETRAFLRCLATGRGWWPDLREGVWSSAAAEAIQSGRDGPVESS